MHTRRIARQGNALGITIPRVLLLELKWKPGDTLALLPTKDALVLHSLERVRQALLVKSPRDASKIHAR